jgi:hypothetical protein
MIHKQKQRLSSKPSETGTIGGASTALAARPKSCARGPRGAPPPAMPQRGAPAAARPRHPRPSPATNRRTPSRCSSVSGAPLPPPPPPAAPPRVASARRTRSNASSALSLRSTEVNRSQGGARGQRKRESLCFVSDSHSVFHATLACACVGPQGVHASPRGSSGRGPASGLRPTRTRTPPPGGRPPRPPRGRRRHGCGGTASRPWPAAAAGLTRYQTALEKQRGHCGLHN